MFESNHLRPCGGRALLAVAATLLLSGAPARAQDTPVTFHAVGVNLSNVGKAGATPLDITIERWTSDEELARLKDALVEKGSDALLSALQKGKRVGFIRASSGGLGWDIRYARQTDLPGGGHRVVFATDRPMSFAERTNHPRSADYEFLVGEMHIGANGKGEGKLVPRARIVYDEPGRTIIIENYANQPVRLGQITEKRPKVE